MPDAHPDPTRRQPWLALFPVAFFASVMGLTGLTLSWQKAVYSLGLAPLVSQVLLVLTACVLLGLTCTYLLKALKHSDQVVAEFQHPIQISFFAAFSISLLLLAVATLEVSMALSHYLWICGAGLHLMLTLHVMTQWIHHARFKVQHSTPAWFIPVVGNIIAPIAGVQHGYVEASWFFFAIGLLYWLVLKTLIFNRILFHDPLPEKLLPTLFIMIAPPAVGFVAYLQLNNGQVDNFARLLYYAALFITLLLFTQLPRFSRIRFYLSWWAYSFPLAAFAIATQSMWLHTRSDFFLVLSWATLVGVTFVVMLLLVKTTRALVTGQLFQPD
ncbi:SLAC1 anion channel family protein [Marinobacterium weihaiense]|uniref:SLAC1 anion channel family protein n=1 Tax=Marinobacterium weihaiense TaxID=2851016 RepID=A0ABS6MCK4_9GAMM|nr:SLAC1 anion channel family protein [Marinobacterium weihaiense]MBV0933452.1 SLAC1 anion channel family protein [Marinobacterium weihaiense]